MRPLLTYVGGKQRIANKIVQLIPNHITYIEPYCGGAAVLFAKPYISKVEILNDKDLLIYNLYNVIKTKKDEFLDLVFKRELYHENYFMLSKEIINNQNNYSDVELAWATFYNIWSSYGRMINGHFNVSGRASPKNQAKRYKNLLNELNFIIDRLKNVQFFCKDGIDIIDKYDNDKVFFYIDPPYVNTSKFYNYNFKIDDLIKLIDRLRNIKGKFILSGYDLDGKIDIPNSWYKIDIPTYISISRSKYNNNSRKRVNEILWLNYNPDSFILKKEV